MAYTPPDGSTINAAFDEHYLPRHGDDLYLGNAPYWPRRGDTLWFDFRGEYTPPDGGSITFGGGPGLVIVSSSFDLKAAASNRKTVSVDTRASVQLVVEIARSFDTRAAVAYQRQGSFDTAAALQLNRPPPTPDFVVPWGQLPAVDNRRGSGWRDRHAVNASIGMAWIKRLAVEAQASAAWREKGALDHGRRALWGDCTDKQARSTRSPWRSKKAADQSREFGWSPLQVVQLSRGNRIFSPPAKDLAKALAFDRAIIIDVTDFVVPWGNPPPKDHWHRTAWGRKYYEEICWRRYRPPSGDGIAFNIHTPITLVDDGINIRFRFDQYSYDRRCSWREPSGWRDAYFYRPPVIIPTGSRSRVYIMLNTAFLTRLPERTAIDAKSITVATDWDSLYWTIKAGIGKDSHLALLESTPDGPMIVEAAINSHVWKFQVDRWNTSTAFGSKTRSIDGRSVSAQLGAPMAEVRTRTETSVRTALQLAADELEYTGWTVVLDGLDDWTVPANVFSYRDLTPMAAIKMIADAAGAMVQTDMAAQTIRIKPRFKVAPWDWATATPDVILPDSMATKVDGEWDERPAYNAVHLSGEAGGISARVYREGSAGDLVAPQVTDRLITATEVARARGIAILGASGKWSKHRIELPVFTPPATPGVLAPGTLIQFEESLASASWRGVVTAVSVAASWDKDRGLKVRQTVDIERYRGN